MPLTRNLGQLGRHTVENPQLLRIIGKELRNIEINHHQGHIPPTLPGHLSLTSPRLLLVRTRVTKVGHFPTAGETKDTAVHPGHQTNPALLRHINPLLRMAIIKAVLIPPIERNITTETKINTRIDLHLIPGTKTPNPADLGHGPRAKMGLARGPTVLTGSSEASHLVILRAPIMIFTRVTELVPILVVYKLAIGIILEVEMHIAKVRAEARL